MAIVKTYEISEINADKIHNEIGASNSVTGFLGVAFSNGTLGVLGSSLSNEASLDAVISAHDPSPTIIIADVTPRQIRQALILSGVSLATIEAALNSLSEPTKSLAIAEWEYSNIFQRNRPLVASVGQMLGWTNQQLDDLWLFAATL